MLNLYFQVILLLVFLGLLIVFAFVIKRLESRTHKLERQLKNLRFRSGRQGTPGRPGNNGRPGTPGTPGTPGANGTALDWADFYAAQDSAGFENDNPNPIAPGGAIAFPNSGTTAANTQIVIDSTVTPLGSAVNLKDPGTFLVAYSVLVAEAGQLVIALDNGSGIVEQEATYLGNPGPGPGLISGERTITTTIADVNLSIINPVNQSTPITLVSGAGATGNASANATLSITRIK